jgi:dihydroorotate dehydrogenase electron transfer subunit
MTHRNTILVEEGEILSQQAHAGEQFILRLKAPRIARRAQAGSFIHIECDRLLPMRRPLSIMRADAAAGWIELLYRVFGSGTRLLSRHGPGTRLSLLGPIGRPFTPHPERPRALLLGGGVGIPPMIFLVEEMRRSGGYAPLVLMGSEAPFPFTTRPSQILLPGMPEGVIAAMPLMDDWGIPSRLASLRGYPGCFSGYVTDLARRWLDALSPAQRDEVEIFACGPHPMLEAAAQLARDYVLPCQVSLEEFMACAVGGCAGCTVRIRTADGLAMKRVCVDGPVFDAASVVF